MVFWWVGGRLRSHESNSFLTHTRKKSITIYNLHGAGTTIIYRCMRYITRHAITTRHYHVLITVRWCVCDHGNLRYYRARVNLSTAIFNLSGHSSFADALWSRTAKNPDVSTKPLVRLFVSSLRCVH